MWAALPPAAWGRPDFTGAGRSAVGGLYFEEFQVGQLFRHALRRTLTEADNVFFSALTHNPAALHLDEEYCREHTEFGTRVVNSAFTLGLMVGISVGDTTLGTTVANLGWDEVRFPRPLFHGDTLRVETEVLELRDSASRPQNGIVIFAQRAFNQKDELVATCKRSALMLRKPVPAPQSGQASGTG
jgi:acyl dehydratase